MHRCKLVSELKKLFLGLFKGGNFRVVGFDLISRENFVVLLVGGDGRDLAAVVS